MLLTLTTTHRPATDLGYLLHKNPGRAHQADLAFGRATVVFPERSEERCTAALVIEVDPVGLVRGPGRADQYVNDRPYVASSYLCVALKGLFSTAMSGRSKDRPDLAQTPIPLEAALPCVPCRGGERLLRLLFEPLGYEVEARRLPLDDRFPEWGESALFELKLRATVTLQSLLNHLYVLIPVLDRDKHYWLDRTEVDKLLRAGAGWLADHPAQEAIVRGYLERSAHLTRDALARLNSEEGEPDADDESSQPVSEPKERLHDQRLAVAEDALAASGATRVLDLGCGDGKLLARLIRNKQFKEIVGMDVSLAWLERAERRLKLDRLPPSQAERIKLIHGSLVYRDRRLEGFDAAAIVEVVEHLDPERLAAFERSVFEFSRPVTVVLTTPNREHNAVYRMEEGAMRHTDHRFEWDRAEFRAWCERVAGAHDYEFEIRPVGPEDEEHGAPSQMAVFRR
jgi:3' terminal RNA ribose 2'-O-methyltransferase Hen1